MEPRKPDPWEARDRDRAKREAWRQGKKTTKTSPEPGGFFDGEGGFDWATNALPLGLLAAIVLLLGASVPFDGVPNALLYRSFLTKAGSILLLFLAFFGGANLPAGAALADVRRGPHPLLFLLFLWTTICLVLAPFRGYATLEFVRIIDGIAAYFIAAYALRKNGKQAAALTVGLLIFGSVLSLLQIAEVGQAQGGFRAEINMSRLGAHGNIGSVLLLLWPPALAFAVWPGIEEKRRIAAIAAALIIGCALLVERARASWIGAAGALIVLAVCYVVTQKSAKTRQAKSGGNLLVRAAGSPWTLLLVGLVLLLGFGGGIAKVVGGRAATLGSGAAVGGATFQSRLHVWGGAAHMTREKPLTGWGLGAYPVLQGRWTHTGDEVQAALTNGADNLSLAHNYYLQWAAETGYPGIFLYAAFAAAFFVTLFAGLTALETPFQKALISGVLALFVGTHIDALASPSHHFHGVWALLWVWMGLGLAVLRPLPARSANADTQAALPLAGGGAKFHAAWGAGAVLGMLSVLAIFGFSARLQAQGKRVPSGVFEVSAVGSGAGRGGTTLAWTARFHDENGQSVATSPGTQWSVDNSSSPGMVRAAQLSLYVPPFFNSNDYEGQTRRSEFRVLVPAEVVRAALSADPKTAPQITVRAAYLDAYGRRYEAWSTRPLSAP